MSTISLYQNHRTGRRSILPILALLAIPSLVFLVLWIGTHDVAKGGPLQPDLTNINSEGFPTKANSTFSFGVIHLRNMGTEPAVLSSVSLADATSGFELIGTGVSPSDGPDFVLDESFPPQGMSISPLKGAKLLPYDENNPETDLILVLALHVGSKPSYDFRSVKLEYRVGNKAYEATLPWIVRVCTPESVTDCPAI